MSFRLRYLFVSAFKKLTYHNEPFYRVVQFDVVENESYGFGLEEGLWDL